MDLKPEKVQSFYNDKLDEGLSERTVRYMHIILNSALSQAFKLGKVPRNVAKLTEPPKQKTREMRVLTAEEQEKFYEAIHDERLGALFLLDLATGLRRGELLALTWDNVNLEEKFIRISSSLVRVKTNFEENEDKKSELIIQEPKTEKGKRVIPLLNSIVDELKEHRKRQLEEIANATDKDTKESLYDKSNNLHPILRPAIRQA
jgi:Site-specific recombinase XerD